MTSVWVDRGDYNGPGVLIEQHDDASADIDIGGYVLKDVSAYDYEIMEELREF